MIFECRELETRGPHGELTAVGVAWCEPRVAAEKFYDWLTRMARVVAIIAGGLAVLGGLVGGSAVFVPVAMVAAVAFGLTRLGAWYELETPGKDRTIMLGRDGVITSSQDGTWQTRVSDIRSIEAVQLKQRQKWELWYTHGVRIVTRRGRVLHVAKDLVDDDAVTLAVMLSEAVETVKFADQVQVTDHADERAMVW